MYLSAFVSEYPPPSLAAPSFQGISWKKSQARLDNISVVEHRAARALISESTAHDHRNQFQSLFCQPATRMNPIVFAMRHPITQLTMVAALIGAAASAQPHAGRHLPGTE